MAKQPSVMSSSPMEEDEQSEKAIAKRFQKMREEDAAEEVKSGRPSSGQLAIVRNNGKIDPSATGRLSANNTIDAIREKNEDPRSAKARATKNYNVPAQITEEDRQKGRDEIARAKREMKSESDVPSSDKEGLTKMLESEEGFKRGGSVRKYAEGGLVRGSVRGCGVALRGHGKGKVY